MDSEVYMSNLILNKRSSSLNLYRTVFFISITALAGCSGGSSSSTESGSSQSLFESSTISPVTTGHYLVQKTAVTEVLGHENLNFTETFEYSLANGDNSILYTRFRNGELENTVQQTFYANGSPHIASIILANGSPAAGQTVSYNENGAISKIAYRSSFDEYNYDSGSIKTRDNYSDGRKRTELVFSYNESDKLITTILRFINSSGETFGTVRCNYTNENDLRVAYTCEVYNINSSTWTTFKEATYEHDAFGNRTKEIVSATGPSAITSRTTTTYQYRETDRSVPNMVLFNELYLPSIEF